MVVRRVYGAIDGIPEGTTFPDREAVRAAGVHLPTQPGISGGSDGADSIVLSGGYPDDEDHGDEIIYTGHGGRSESGHQVEDQVLTKGNLGLARSKLDQREVRVVRKCLVEGSSKAVYRYDGLFQVVDYWHSRSADGPLIWRFRLCKISGGPSPAPNDDHGTGSPAPRAPYAANRILRDPAVSKQVKLLHDHRCQFCGIQLVTAAGPHAEGAHIRALGKPHDGPDMESNVLCLCPNHHVLFDEGAIIVDDTWTVRNALTGEPLGPLRTAPGHSITAAHLRYHREHRGS